MIVLFLFYQLCGAAALAGDPASVDRGFEIVEEQYPAYRFYWGSYYIAGGLYAGAWGLKELFSADDTVAALAGFGLSMTAWITFFDGLRLCGPESEPEVVLARYKRYAPGTAKDFGGVVSREEFGRTRLRTLSDEAYTGRMLRLGSHLVTAGALFYFYGVGSDKGSYFLLVPAITFTAAGLYRLFQESPEERGSAIAAGHQLATSWRIVPTTTSLWLQVHF